MQPVESHPGGNQSLKLSMILGAAVYRVGLRLALAGKRPDAKPQVLRDLKGRIGA